MELFNWMEDALAKGQPVVYITVGSYCILQEWSLNALYYGLKKLKCKVVWSLKKEYKTPAADNDPDFWIDSWIPQI